MRLNSYGHSFLAAASRLAELRPKSSFTDRSAASLEAASDSDVDLPRNSHRLVRAKPCWGRDEVAWFAGGGPNTCVRRTMSVSGRGAKEQVGKQNAPGTRPECRPGRPWSRQAWPP